MTVLAHLFQSLKADGPDPTEMQPSHWNAGHVFAGGALGSLLYRDTVPADGASWLADVAVGSVLVSGGIGVAPAWSASPAMTALSLGAGSVASPSLRLGGDTGSGFLRAGADQVSFVGAGLGLTAGGKCSFTVRAEALGGTGQDGSGSIFRVDAYQDGALRSPSFQVNRGGGVRVYDYFMVFPLPTTNFEFSTVFGSEAFMLGAASDLGASGSTMFLTNNASHHDLLRLSDFVSFTAEQIASTRRFTFTGAGLLAFGSSAATAPGLKANSTALEVRLGDDSAQAVVKALAFSAGTNPAAAGGVRLPNNTAVTGRNQANTGDLNLIYLDTTNAVNIGDTGTLKLVGTDIQWGRALVALGGGAAPTLGTIGGSGPAAAAQNTWMRILDSTGAAFYVPAWK